MLQKGLSRRTLSATAQILCSWRCSQLRCSRSHLPAAAGTGSRCHGPGQVHRYCWCGSCLEMGLHVGRQVAGIYRPRGVVFLPDRHDQGCRPEPQLWCSYLICLLGGGTRRGCWSNQVTSVALATIGSGTAGHAEYREHFCQLQGMSFHTK